jgi:orotidine-5'-phosphate decarboxylase
VARPKASARKDIMTKKNSQLIVAMDVGSLAEMRGLLDTLWSTVDIFKVGSQLFTSCGPAAVRFVQARGRKVFLDLKFHDIPNTVANAVTAAVELSMAVERSAKPANKTKEKRAGLFMYTLHTAGGLDMMKAAVEAGTKAAQKLGVAKPLAVGVTVLTSEEKKENVLPLVLERAALGKKAGLDGVVASCHEAKFLRQEFGNDFLIVTPGIRSSGADTQDQERVATPREAVLSGSNFLVVGRPIVKAPDPFAAAKKILDEMRSA